VSEIDTAIKRWPTATLWVASYFLGGVVGAVLIGWIIANDSHTGVGMGGFALAVGLMFLACVSAALGGVLLIFRSTRELAVILLSGGAGTLTAALLGIFH